MRITIVGTGHGGCAMAAVMAMRGHQMSLLKLGNVMHLDNFRALGAARKIHLIGIEGNGTFPLDKVTEDPAEAIPDADLVLVYYVANYHPAIAARLAPYLHAGQAVVLNPGYAGSLIFTRAMQAAGNTSQPLFAEFETLPYSSRIVSPGFVSIVSRNVRHPFAAYPARRSAELVSYFEPVLGECVPRRHIFEVALHNPNLVIHTVGVLMNVSLVEHPAKNFAMYRDGFSPAVWNVVLRLDKEKMDVLEKLGAPRITYFDEFKLRTFGDTAMDSMQGFRHYASEAPDGPFAVEHRYVTEDVPMGLGLLHSLGKATGVPTPICDSLIHIASGLLPAHDFWKEARTVDQLWDGSFQELMDELAGMRVVSA